MSLILGAWCGMAAPWCAAQSEIGGSVTGHIAGPGGRWLAGAQVRIENAATGESTDAASDSRGDFQFADLAPGEYTVRVGVPGLSNWEADHVLVGLGTATRLHPVLAPLSVHRTVLVDGQGSRRGAAADDNIEAGLANELPNNSQHWSQQAALFADGVADTGNGMSFRGLSPLLNAISVDGTDDKLAFRAQERGTAGNGFATPQSAVGEFQTVAQGQRGRRGGLTTVTRGGARHMYGSAVFYDRGSVGQATNAFTKVMQMEPVGTTGIVNGEPVLLLDGQPVTYQEEPWHAPDRRQSWEVSAGGPIRRGRVDWFFVWEQHERNDPAVARANEPQVFFSAPSALTLTTLEARIAGSTSPLLQGCPAGAAESGSTAQAACGYAAVLNQLNSMLGKVPRATRQTIVFPRIDVHVNNRNQVTLQYNSMRRTAPFGGLGGATETDSIGSFGNSSTSDDAAVARWERFATAHLASSLRYQYSRDVLSQAPGSASSFEKSLANNFYSLPPQISIDRSAGFTFGTRTTVDKPEYPAETRQQLMEAMTWIHEKQAMRFGYDYNHVVDVVSGLNNETGSYSYASLLDFISDLLAPDSCDGTTSGTGEYPCYSQFRQAVGPPNWSFQTADYAAYWIDEWRPAHRLSLTAGVRYEYERVPDTNADLINAAIPQTADLPHNKADFGPRAGLAWDIRGNGQTVLRGGFGISYGRVPNATVYSALTDTGSAGGPRTYMWRPMDAGAPVFPYVFASGDPPYTDPDAPDQQTSAPDVVYFDRDFRRPQINSFDLSLQQALGSGTLLTLAAIGSDGHDLTQFMDTNLDRSSTATIFYSVAAPGNEGNIGPLGKAANSVGGYTVPIYTAARFYYRRLNPAYGSMTDVISETNSSYRGAVVRLVHRMRALQINAGYTWGHAIDDGQNAATFADRNDVYDPADMRLEHGTSNYDVRQRVAGGVVAREPWRPRGAEGVFLGGYSLSAAGQWRTGLPWTMRTIGAVPAPSCSYLDWLNAGGATGRGSDCLQVVHNPDETFDSGQAGEAVPIPAPGLGLNGAGGENLIPAIGRNTYRYPAGVTLDLRLTKHIRLSDRCSFDLMADGFNALNHRNVTEIQTMGYRLTNDATHPNMATLTWQSGMKPQTKTVLVNGITETEYAYDPTAAFGGVTNANSGTFSRERQLQIGIRLRF
ncbi:MAG: carboxypeptidase regulatory-like domain-containing protein [Acidobacteriaceae bacterium]